MEKINISVPPQIKQSIDLDALSFEIFKKDGLEINRNLFLNTLIYNYAELYFQEKEAIISLIKNYLEKEKIINTLSNKNIKELSNLYMTDIDNKRTKKTLISLKPTIAIEPIIDDLLAFAGESGSFSGTVSDMLTYFFKKNGYERELIYFRDKVEVINKAIKDNKSLSFNLTYGNESKHIVFPFAIANGKDEIHNYLICQEYNAFTNANEVRSYRLNRLNRLSISQRHIVVDNTVRCNAEKTIKNYPQYAVNESSEICVKMDSIGIRSYKRIYFNRPIMTRFEKKDDYYLCYFDCSFDQAFIYFRRFYGENAIVIYPQKLKEKILNFHKKSTNAYNGENQ